MIYKKDEIISYVNENKTLYHTTLNDSDFKNYNIILDKKENKYDSIEFFNDEFNYYIHIHRNDYLKFLRFNKLNKIL